ncbi:hypothetical protein EV122DRAFT_281924 [Schizophyllum commune]
MESLTARPYSQQCSVPEFYETYVESTNYERVPTRTLARIISILRRRGDIDRSTGEWTDLHGKGVASNDGRMKALYDHVLGAAAEVCPRRFSPDKKTTTYTCSSGLETAADIPGATYYADAVSYLAQPSYTREATPGTAHNHVATAQGQSRIVYTADVGMTWGLTPFADSSHIQRNEDQTLYAAQHILYNDICHTCQFAVTIEGSSVRLWYHTRSRTIFTERFDMHKHSDELIQIILFSSFASPAQLGFDPAVHRVVVGNELHYQFDVSVEIELEDAASNLHCQAMRVFKVVDCGNLSGPCRALQDNWRSDDAEVSEEGKIQDAIFCAMEKTMTEDELIDIRRHFMLYSPMASWLVRIDPGKHLALLFRDLWCQDRGSHASPRVASTVVIQVLDKMRRAGYVHRDVSLGHIMLQCMDTLSTTLSERYITKLADLEYTRAYDKIANDRGVGTSVFMAVEVQAQEHIFASCREEELLTLNYFAYNPLHDVESTLWGAIYFALHRCSRRVLENTDWKVMRDFLLEAESYERAVCVPCTSGSPQRRALIIRPYGLCQFRKQLSHLYGDDSVMLRLVDAVECLRKAYDAVENSTLFPEEDHNKFFLFNDPNSPRLPLSVFSENAGVYDELCDVFREISEHFHGQEGSPSLVRIAEIDFDTGRIGKANIAIAGDVPDAPTPDAGLAGKYRFCA